MSHGTPRSSRSHRELDDARKDPLLEAWEGAQRCGRLELAAVSSETGKTAGSYVSINRGLVKLRFVSAVESRRFPCIDGGRRLRSSYAEEKRTNLSVHHRGSSEP